ncbi:MAG: hypothetical protein OEV63_00525 [Gammaproteobacteria bacterium]|nr:hypothetical protein [Gammaproteobacteria bacterium]MDH5213810.1 hypothetical protein [Gammaproteobacteria bacterium]
MNFSKQLAALMCAILLGGGSSAVADDFWVGAKVGTLGIGVEGAWRPIPWLDLRLGANAYDYEESGSQAGINYDATLSLSTYYGTANLLFPASPFRISVGAFSNGNEIPMVSDPGTSYDIGGVSYSAAEVGTLRSNTTFDSLSPYLGAGFDFSLFNKVGMTLDFGVLWQGDPQVTLTSDGTLANNPTFQSQLEIERSELEDDFDALKAYPVVSLGFNFRF